MPSGTTRAPRKCSWRSSASTSWPAKWWSCTACRTRRCSSPWPSTLSSLKSRPTAGGGATRGTTRWLKGGKPAQAEITVSDNGPGFREDILRRAFEPYVTSKARGTGLGLAIVQRIVEEHGGRITAENLAGGGARVRVLLPAAVDKRTELRRERA